MSRSRCQSRHFPAYRVEAGNDDRLGRVVDDEVDSGGRFDGPDISSLPADDASLHFVGGQRHNADGFFGDEVSGIALNGQGQNLLGLLVGGFPSFVLDLLDPLCGIMTGLALHSLHEVFFGFFGAHPRNFFQPIRLLQDQLLDILFPGLEPVFLLPEVLVSPPELFVLGVNLRGFPLEVFLFLEQPFFLGQDFPTHFPRFLLPVGFGLEDRVLGLDDGLLADGVRLFSGLLQDLLGSAFGVSYPGLGQLAPQQDPDRYPDPQGDSYQSQYHFYSQNRLLLVCVFVDRESLWSNLYELSSEITMSIRMSWSSAGSFSRIWNSKQSPTRRPRFSQSCSTRS